MIHRLIFFHSPRDKESKAFKDKYIKLAATLKLSGIKTGAVNCEKEEVLCERHQAGHLTRDGKSI